MTDQREEMPYEVSPLPYDYAALVEHVGAGIAAQRQEEKHERECEAVVQAGL
jgi:hypothetical protein